MLRAVSPAVVLACLVALVGLFDLIARWERASGRSVEVPGSGGGFRSAPTPTTTSVLVAAALAVAVGAVLLARRRPVTATLLALAPFVLALAPPPVATTFRTWDLAWLIALLAVAGIATVCNSHAAPLAWVGAVTVAVLSTSWLGVEAPIGLDPWDPWWFLPASLLAMVAVAAVVSVLVRMLVRSTHRQEKALVAAAAARSRSRVATERARAARDLHDVVAHHVSLVAVRAESAPFLHQDLDDEVRELFAAIAVDARAALAELRTALVVLGRGIDDAPGEALDDVAPRRPQPTAGDVPALLREVRAAGQQVTVDDEEDLPERLGVLDAAGGRAAYRAIQEALTNARRHGTGSATHLSVVAEDDRVLMTVTNKHGRPDASCTHGRGLVGMAEDLAAVGGELAVTADDGRFVVRCYLPYESGAPGAR